jgi:hypothetical protein
MAPGEPSGVYGVIRDQQGQSRQVPLAPQGGQWRDHRRQPGYEKKANAEKGIEAVRKAAADATVADLTEETAKR